MDLKHVINQTSNSAELILYGQVGYDFDCNEVAQEMDFLSQMGVKNIKARINSTGGSVFNGLSFVGACQHFNGNIITINDGICASMGAIMLMCGDDVCVLDYSRTMLHEPTLYGQSIEELEDSKEKTALINARSIISTLVQKKTGKQEQEVLDLLKAETWYDADSCIVNNIANKCLTSKIKPQIKNELTAINDIANFHYAKELTKNQKQMDNQEKLEFEKKISDISDKLNSKEAELKTSSEKLLDSQNKLDEINSKLAEKESKITELNQLVDSYKTAEIENYVVSLENDLKLEKEKHNENVELAKKDFEAFKLLTSQIKPAHVDLLNKVNNINKTDPNLKEKLNADITYKKELRKEWAKVRRNLYANE